MLAHTNVLGHWSSGLCIPLHPILMQTRSDTIARLLAIWWKDGIISKLAGLKPLSREYLIFLSCPSLCLAERVIGACTLHQTCGFFFTLTQLGVIRPLLQTLHLTISSVSSQSQWLGSLPLNHSLWGFYYSAQQG